MHVPGGIWTGDIDGTWTPEPAPRTHITIRQGHEHIRYLGVHFAMDGNWNYQLERLVGGHSPQKLAYDKTKRPATQSTHVPPKHHNIA
jgi:hypothetical protein